MTLVIFAITLSADFLLLSVILLSIIFPNSRIWPPPKKGSWQQLISWTLFTVVMFGVPLIGVLDFQSLATVGWGQLLIGGFLIAFGLGIDLWGTKTLSAQQSLGNNERIITTGPYRLTRNPQYVGFIILFFGLIIVASSNMALVTGLFAVGLFFFIPFSEEPWLRQQYGEAYVEYCRNVPRFIGLRSFKRSK